MGSAGGKTQSRRLGGCGYSRVNGNAGKKRNGAVHKIILDNNCAVHIFNAPAVLEGRAGVSTLSEKAAPPALKQQT